jgi:tyrosine-protein kinase Etk/Wzc
MSDKKKANILDLDDLRSFLKVFSKNWYIILFFILSAFTLSYFYTYKLPDVYAAKSQILLKNQETYDYQNQIYKGIGYYQSYQDNSNQIRVLTSNDLIGEALNKLKFDVSYFIVGRLKTTEVYNGMPFDITVKMLNQGLYEKEIKFKILNVKQFELSYIKENETVTKKLEFNKEVIDNDFYLVVKKNDILNEKTIKSLKEIDYLIKIHREDYLISKIKSQLHVENVENTTILELTLEDQIPLRAITFLDTLSDAYINYTSKSQIAINNNTLDNIDKQLKEITDVLTSIEDDMENYRANKAILDIDKQQNDYFEKLIEFDSQKRKAELTIQSLESLQKYIVSVGNITDEKLLPPSFYISEGDDYLKTALGKLYELQMERNQRLNGSTIKNRNISELDQELDLLKNNILTYITNSKIGLSQRIDDLKSQINNYTSIIKTVPRTERDLLNIQRKLDVNQKMYSFLLEKRASTMIARAGILPETSIIEAAHSIGVVAPNKRKILYYFIIAAVILSLTVIFIRTSIFATIENIMELKRLTTIPILGEIILYPSDNENYFIVDKDAKAPITESFRAIRTNLEYFASERKSKVVLLTSYLPGEGKTFCSVNLSTILAKAGKKVLLLELDLHKPKVQKAFNMESVIGASNVLIGKSDISSTIQKTEIENLFVMLSGPTPPNASELIVSKYLTDIFDYGRENFDYVIVDTPPVGLITDALVMMKNVDVSLFVINTKFAKKQIINIVEEIVQTNKLQNFALILNGVKRRKSGYYYNYGYGYGYGYGTGYGYGYGSSYGYGTKPAPKKKSE